jgi:hypothetical protein
MILIVIALVAIGIGMAAKNSLGKRMTPQNAAQVLESN